jgi:hypothetical protein
LFFLSFILFRVRFVCAIEEASQRTQIEWRQE